MGDSTRPTPQGLRLLADLGGTHLRLAVQRGPGGPLEQAETCRTGDQPGLAQAVLAYLAARKLPTPAALCIGVASEAGAEGDIVAMTNHPWRFSRTELVRTLGLSRLLLLNDFTALAWSLPDLDASTLRQIGGGVAVPDAPRALIGPGTGLGVSGLMTWRDASGAAHHLPLAGEGGHTTLPVGDAIEQAVVAWLVRRYGHASAERALSGPGLRNIHAALCEIDGVGDSALAPTEISRRALAGEDPRCLQALALFAGWLGSVAGNLALTLGARGGLYLGGGMVPHLAGWLAGQSSFRERFEAKGRFRGYLASIPVWVIDEPLAALIGAARALDDDAER